MINDKLKEEYEGLRLKQELARFEIAKNQKLYNKYEEEKKTVQKQLGNPIEISDHAIVRYLERVQNYKFSDVKANIIDDEIIQQANANNGNGKFANKNGLRVLMKNHVVITVLKKSKKQLLNSYANKTI